MKTTRSDMNNTLVGINSRLNITEENIGEPEDIARETTKMKLREYYMKEHQ